jgi:UDP-N-acetylmuramyl pentapeptide phosphotransferase/UDP-N-acetylglucosamine-1-phosphate transferase
MEPFKLILLVLSTFSFVWFAIPTLIQAAHNGRFFDKPDHERKVHLADIPNLGGVAIFFGFLFGCILFLKAIALEYSNFLLGASMIVFAMGIRDDLMGLNAYVKIFIQLIAAFLVVYFGGVRIDTLFGLFGVQDLPILISIPFSIFIIIVITNAINLIDGIDGLATLIGIVITAAFGIVFLQMNQLGWSRISFALCGALLGFIRYNFSPAKIFMGDTGAYIIGFILAILTIQFMELNRFDTITNNDPFIKSSPAVGIGFMFVPLFDTLRVFMIRISQGKSPFFADRRHMHHFLLDRGWNHRQTSLFLAGMSVFFIFFSLALQNIGSFYLIGILIVIGIAIHFFMEIFKIRNEKV